MAGVGAGAVAASRLGSKMPRSRSDPDLPSAAAIAAGSSASRFDASLAGFRSRDGLDHSDAAPAKRRRIDSSATGIGDGLAVGAHLHGDSLHGGGLTGHSWFNEHPSASREGNRAGAGMQADTSGFGGSLGALGGGLDMSIQMKDGSALAEIVLRSNGASRSSHTQGDPTGSRPGHHAYGMQESQGVPTPDQHAQPQQRSLRLGLPAYHDHDQAEPHASGAAGKQQASQQARNALGGPEDSRSLGLRDGLVSSPSAELPESSNVGSGQQHGQSSSSSNWHGTSSRRGSSS